MPATRCLTAVDVDPIQVTVETVIKPPTTFIFLSTVTVAGVLILVKGREPLTTEIGPRGSGIPSTIT